MTGPARNNLFPVQVVGAAILDSFSKPSRILLGRRSAPAELAGLWEFPGGKVEAGESCGQALARELDEELGVSVRLGQEIVGEYEQGWRLNRRAAMRVFCAEIIDGAPEPLQDHSALRWFALTRKLLDLPWIPADLPIVNDLLETAGTDTPASRNH